MDQTERQRMTELCNAILVEQDSHRMLRLFEELNALLEIKQEWMMELCTAIAGERDPHRMAKLVEELNRLPDGKQGAP